MKTTIEARKQKATELLKKLDIYKPYIKGFVENNQVCFFEGYGGYWVDQEPEVEKKMRELEQKHKCCVFAITHEYLEFGECWDFLIVPEDDDDWDFLADQASGNVYYTLAYVWNKDYEYDSEFGDIAVRSFGGGVCRVG